MKVTFVYCAVGVAGFNANRPPCDREGSWIGHGVASVAASTIMYGHEVDLLDLRRLSGWAEFIERIQKNPADVYGLSVAPVDYPHALMAVYNIKTTVPKAKIIVGGIHPSIFPMQYDFTVIDTIVVGEGEVTFPKLLKEIDSLPRMVRGERPELDSLPYVARQLFDYDAEMLCNFTPDQKTPSITMIAGRGCPYHCNYCQPAENAVFGSPYRMRSPENVVWEMERLYETYLYKSVTFWDDTFTVSRKWVSEFCELWKETGIKSSIAVCSRADIICHNEDMVEQLSETGVDWFVIGLESGSQRLLDLIKKGTTIEQNMKAAEICRKHGIKIFGTYMYGLPTETREDSRMTFDMIQAINPEHKSPFWYTPIQGTGLYKICDDLDLIIDKDRGIERTGHFTPTLRGVDYEYITTLMRCE